ncbi:hypothetical protein [Desulfofarcimen acetoxidans]|nr:hypothetical protein [Desulfofarcimen acetoxidans]
MSTAENENGTFEFIFRVAQMPMAARKPLKAAFLQVKLEKQVTTM